MGFEQLLEPLITSGPLALVLGLAATNLWKARKQLEDQFAAERAAWTKERSELVAAKSEVASMIRAEYAERLEALHNKQDALLERVVSALERRSDA